MPLLTWDSVVRTTISTTLKSVGVTARIMDFPPDNPELKRQAAKRELIDLGLIVVSSLGLEALFHIYPGHKQLHKGIKFLPQFAAYVFAEWFSRKVTHYKSALHDSLRRPEVSSVPAKTSGERLELTSIASAKGKTPTIVSPVAPTAPVSVTPFNYPAVSYTLPYGYGHYYYPLTSSY